MSNLEIPGSVIPEKDDDRDRQPFLGKFLNGRFSFSPVNLAVLSALNGMLGYEFIKSVTCARGLMACGWAGFGIIFPVYLPLMGFIGRMNLAAYVLLFVLAAAAYSYIAHTFIRYLEQKLFFAAGKRQISSATHVALRRLASQ